jgi:DNA modification methylase
MHLAAGGDGTHSAAFPVDLPAWFIRAYSDPGDTVFDPFMGSGSTLIAAHQENRTAYGSEISPAYTDVICKRFQDYAGIKPERVLPDGTTEPVSFT